MKKSLFFSLVLCAFTVVTPVSANVIKAAAEILVKEGPGLIKGSVKGAVSNTKINPIDVLKKIDSDSRLHLKQAQVLLEVASGSATSLRPISKDINQVSSELALEKFASMKHWKSFAYLGKNSKQQHVFVKANPVRTSKGVNGADGAYEINHDANIEIQIVRGISEARLKELRAQKKGLGIVASEMHKDVSVMMKKAGERTETTLLNGSEYNIFPALDYNQQKNMLISLKLDSSFFNDELLKDVLTELLK